MCPERTSVTWPFSYVLFCYSPRAANDTVAMCSLGNQCHENRNGLEFINRVNFHLIFCLWLMCPHRSRSCHQTGGVKIKFMSRAKFNLNFNSIFQLDFNLYGTISQQNLSHYNYQLKRDPRASTTQQWRGKSSLWEGRNLGQSPGRGGGWPFAWSGCRLWGAAPVHQIHAGSDLSSPIDVLLYLQHPMHWSIYF